MYWWSVLLVSVLPLFVDAGCFCTYGQYKYGICKLSADPAQAQGLTGIVKFRQKTCSWCSQPIQISIDISGLPVGTTAKHGFHIHQLGDVSEGCGSTGGHYNPYGRDHGAPTDSTRHIGDLGNVNKTAQGTIVAQFSDRLVKLTGRTSVMGRAVVLHAGVDDLGKGGDDGSKKTGNAGSRLGCCVIGVADEAIWTEADGSEQQQPNLHQGWLCRYFGYCP